MDLKFIDQIPLKGKRVLIRADFNVPVDELNNITDDNRIRGVLPTINYALDEGAKVILASHMGRPKGKPEAKYSLITVAKRLKRLLNKEIVFVDEAIGKKVEEAVARMKPGEVMLLENLRFYPGEEKNEQEFAKELAKLADVYINDAFAVSHRANASVAAITGYVKEVGAGFLMKKEISYFKRALEDPMRPLVAIIGGAKVSDKLKALKNLTKKVDKLVIGGGMAFTFIAALGHNVGKSLLEENMKDTASDVMKEARERGVKLYLPVDCIVAEKVDSRSPTKTVTIQEIPDGWMGLDIGPATTSLFVEAIENAKTIVWNGPMGVFEIDQFSRGSLALAHAVARVHALKIVGGGDTDVVINKAGEIDSITFVSTGGGAFIELLEGKELPGIAALRKA
jgi:phosphoglycerate kinase